MGKTIRILPLDMGEIFFWARHEIWVVHPCSTALHLFFSIEKFLSISEKQYFTHRDTKYPTDWNKLTEQKFRKKQIISFSMN